MGPPSEFTKELGDAICARISEGEPLAAICREEGMPNRITVWRWMERHPEFGEQMKQARDMGELAILDECMEIADDKAADYVQTEKGPAFNPEHVQRSKLRVWTRLELLKKWNPKKWGDKQQLEHTGPDGGPVQFQKIERTIVDPADSNG